MKSTWPTLPREDDIFLRPTSRVETNEPEPATACKHGFDECERCGTTSKDTLHTTSGGRGCVARLR